MEKSFVKALETDRWNRLLARRVALAIAFFGLGSIVMRGLSLGAGHLYEGVVAALVDPGFTGFSVLLMPLAAFIFIRHIPTKMIASAWQAHPWNFAIITSVLAIAATVGAGKDAYDAICNRISTPEMYANKELKACLLYMRNIQLGMPNEIAQDVACPQPEHRGMVLEPSNLRQPYEDLLKPNWGKQCNYLKQASFYAYYGAIGSVSAAWTIALMVFLVLLPIPLIFPGNYKFVANDFWRVYLAMYALLSVWLLLVPFSQWYINLGGPWDYDIIAVIAAAVVTCLCGWLFATMIQRGLAEVFRVLVAIGGVAASVIAKWYQEIIGQIAKPLFSLSGFYLFPLCVLLIAIILFIGGYGTMRRRD